MATILYFVNPIFNKNSQLPVQEEGSVRSQQLSQLIERKIVYQWIDTLKNLATILPSSEPEINRFLETWIKKNDHVICISVWIEGKRWPIRIVQNAFWEKNSVRQLTETNQQHLYNYIFQDESTLDNRNKSQFIGPIFSQEILGFPLISVGVSLQNQKYVQVLEIKRDLDDISNIFKTILKKGEVVTIFDSDQKIIYSSTSDSTIREKNANLHVSPLDNKNIFTSDFTYLPWTFQLEREPILAAENKLVLKIEFVSVFIIGILFTLLLGLLLSRWIDKPTNELIATATEVARGNFVKRIPTKKNQQLNRLIKLFNYMAEEMYNLQQIDIAEIVNEKNKTETILRNIADGVIVTDSQDRILVINAVAEKWFGLDEKDVIQKPIKQYIQNPHLIALLQEVKNGKLQCSAEFSFSILEEHEKKVFQANAARIHNQEDVFVGVVTVIRDVTKEKEADRIKTELVSMVAHELKSPLTSIYGFSELLLDAKLKDPKAEEYANVILTESTRLTDLINKYLDLSRLESGHTEIRINPFSLKQIVNKIIETYKGQTEKKKIRVIQEISENLPLAMGDQDMIEQVLLNLFSNAIKYSPPRSKIGIEVKEEEKNLIINVIDNGYGIPEEALPKIFNKFYRVADSEGSDEIEGSGLGLSLSKEIVERHGGTIKVTSRLGVGSVFSFTLPKADTI